jgi:acetoin:2,6-dichlorophenolindophenol oxidoreductase subunit beta
MPKVLTYQEAINEALIQAMSLNNKIYILGQGAPDSTSAVGPFAGIKEKFGDRIQDTPMSEEAIAGICVGMSMNGLKVINSHIRMDFMLLAMNQIINMASKISYMYGGRIKAPVIFRGFIGKSWGQGATHSQGLYPLFCHIPGIEVYAPATPYDAKGVYLNSLLNKNVTTLIVEHRLLYYQKGEVPENVEDYKFEPNRVLKKGKDITLVGVSQMAVECLRAAKLLEKINIEAEVITPISLKPIKLDHILSSVMGTKKLIVVDNSWIQGGIGSEIISNLHECHIDFKSYRMGFENTICPTSPSIEKLFYPSPETIAIKALMLLGFDTSEAVFGKGGSKRTSVIEKIKEAKYEIEETEFKGPF